MNFIVVGHFEGEADYVFVSECADQASAQAGFTKALKDAHRESGWSEEDIASRGDPIITLIARSDTPIEVTHERLSL